MALCLDSMTLLPALGAAMLLPSTLATALRLEGEAREAVTVPPSVQALLQRVIIDGDLDLGVDFEVDSENGREQPTTMRTPLDDLDADGGRPGLDTWSVVWYCGMFAAFTSLFLIMPCSQVLCRAGLLQGHGDPRLRPRAPLAALHGYATPPPPYKQFAPPAYEDVVLDLEFDLPPPGKAVPAAPSPAPVPAPAADKDRDKDKGGGLEVYVIPLRPPPGPEAAV